MRGINLIAPLSSLAMLRKEVHAERVKSKVGNHSGLPMITSTSMNMIYANLFKHILK